ncbi:MAG TPA: LamG-like jellyroll fold domain-containing protein, partial [Pyrinomonadaceae bacterium]|nr:LamG-like jellyroll fold domain-containing protein [Pyrinomonadaceae bacterium]
MLYHVTVPNALVRTFICSLFIAWVLSAAGATPARAQGGVDEHTLLLLHFENSPDGAQGEKPTESSGITFEAGIVGQGALIERADLLSYAAPDNFNMPAGTIEFWIKPRWGRLDPLQRSFLSVSNPVDRAFQLTFFKTPNTHLHFVLGAEDSEAGQSYPSADWNANEWHHLAITWTVPGRMITYI